MNLEALKKQLIIDEGCKLDVYLDHLGNPTFGIGHLLTTKDPELMQWKHLPKGGKMRVSQETVDKAFEKDVAEVCRNCRQVFDDFDELPEEVQQIIANMMFNLGLVRFRKFTNLIAAIQAKNFKKAAQEMKNSKWYEDTKDRAKRLVARMDKFANDFLCHV